MVAIKELIKKNLISRSLNDLVMCPLPQYSSLAASDQGEATAAPSEA